jgi:hypothetical protein
VLADDIGAMGLYDVEPDISGEAREPSCLWLRRASFHT